jgi:hypothetical protein
MNTFLGLPQELRDKILTLTIPAPLSPPQAPAPNEDHQSALDKYTFFHSRMNAMPTLLVNKQLYRETMAAINRLPTKHSYDLDVMVFNEDKLWPTWLSVPTVTNEVEKVRVTFRSVGTVNAIEGGAVGAGFSGGDGGPPRIIWAFYDLLTRFILGTPYDWKMHREDKFLKHDVSIKLLELDIRSPDVPANMIAPDIRYNRLQNMRRHDGIDYLMNPAFLATFLENHLHSLLQGHIAEYGRFLYERIGTINVYLDGELREEWNIGNLLATLKQDHFIRTYEYPKPQPADHRKLFENWRRNVYNSRKKFGLPTMPFELED